MKVLEARAKAQQIAFGPMVFQAVRVLWKSGILATIEAAGEKGISVAELSAEIGTSEYGVSVLCDMAMSAEVIAEYEDRFRIAKLGSILLHDRLTQVNVNFVHDVCYQGMFELDRAISEGRPAGLSVFSDAETIYQCITDLPPDVQQSWYEFDHYYSDRAFSEATEIVFRQPVSRLLDIGGNTGKWALRALGKDPEVKVTIADLPGQLERAKSAVAETPDADRCDYLEVNLLSANASLSGEYDTIWMSQFLDCFSEAQISSILEHVHNALSPNGTVYIMETLTDRQRYDAAAYSLNATSLYFTAMANGESRMYRSTTMERLVRAGGFEVKALHNDLGVGHTLMECRLAI